MLRVQDCLIVIIDIQEKLVNAALNGNKVAENVKKISQAARLLDIPIIATEQYPKGLGSTLDGIDYDERLEKNSFSAYCEPDFKNLINKYNKKQILICGIETHICVLQTACDLISNGYEVYVLNDCCASRKEFEHNVGIEFLKSEGAKIFCLEIALFDFLKNSKHPKFKEIQALIK